MPHAYADATVMSVSSCWGAMGKGGMVRFAALDAHRMGKLYLPPGYRLVPDADLMMLYRADGSRVAAFVAGAAPSEVARMAEEDFRATEEERKGVAS